MGHILRGYAADLPGNSDPATALLFGSIKKPGKLNMGHILRGYAADLPGNSDPATALLFGSMRRAAIIISGAIQLTAALALDTELHLLAMRLQVHLRADETAIRLRTGPVVACPRGMLTRRPRKEIKLGGETLMEAQVWNKDRCLWNPTLTGSGQPKEFWPWEAKSAFAKPYAGVQLAIRWIPAHEGIQGNEAADQAAKEAAKQQAKEARPTRQLIPAPSKHTLPVYSGLRKAYSSVLLQLRAGRIGLNHFLHKIKLRDTDQCACRHGAQTPRHILLECRLLRELRGEMWRWIGNKIRDRSNFKSQDPGLGPEGHTLRR
ncbi:hypothetical protein VTN00DRAFT_2757 [Thermoascus crustaceus]|uniref:uncharacterized protein n=1 Tax=Thermoascus crustaceus TaxID=5088 RepID=UPI00374278AE